MIVNKYNQGGGGSGSGMTPQQVQQQIDSALTPYWDSGETKDYVDEAVSGISLEGYYTSAQTEEAITSKNYVTSGQVKTQIESYEYATTGQVDEIDEVVSQALVDLNDRVDELSGATPSIDLSGYYTSAQTEEAISSALTPYYTSAQTEERISSAYTILDEHITEVEQVTSSAYTELHDDIIELSARTIPDMSLYTPTSGFSTINGSAITQGGNIMIEGGSTPDMSAYYTSAQTEEAIISKGYASQDQVDEIDEVVSQALVDLNDRVDELSGATPSVDLSGYYTSAQTEDAISAATSGKADKVNIQDNPSYMWFPKWNSQGIITGQAKRVYETVFSVNGVENKRLINTNGTSMPSFYAPNSAGTAGDILVSTGNGAPVWSAVTIPDMSEYYTSAQTNTAISAATQNMVTSTSIDTIWKGTQAEYDTATQSGATADPNTFYIILPSA